MSTIFATIIAGLIAGQPIETVLAGLTDVQWVELIGTAAADVEPALAKLLGIKTTGNSVGSLIDGLVKAAADEAIKDGLRDLVSANADWAMKLQPGMGPH